MPACVNATSRSHLEQHRTVFGVEVQHDDRVDAPRARRRVEELAKHVVQLGRFSVDEGEVGELAADRIDEQRHGDRHACGARDTNTQTRRSG